MDELFSADFFIGNRERLRQLFTGTAPIIITANGRLQRGTDEPYDFHQDRSFWYLTGVDDPNAILVMDKGKEYLVVPELETVRAMFDGAVDANAIIRRSGIQDVVGEKEGWKRLEGRIRKVKHVATLAAAPRYVDFWGMYTNPARAELIQRLKEINNDIELLDLRPHLGRMRMVKQEVELKALQHAFDVTMDTLKEVTRPSRLTKYGYEYEIEADITHGFRRRGTSGHGFTPIVAGGKHACTIHHIDNNGALSANDLVILDVGAEYNHYTADITRTVALGGHTSRRQEAVFAAVLEAQEYAFSLLRPGVLSHDYEKKMEEFVGEKLRELSLIKTIETETVRKFFPHMTSHFLGLDAHDSGDYERPFEAGVVLAVEPGIYIPEEGIGVRIEDDVVITEDGVKVLTSRLPRTLT